MVNMSMKNLSTYKNYYAIPNLCSFSPFRMEMDGVHRCQNQTSITEHEYAFCYIYIYLYVGFCSGYISTKIKSCTSFECCSFGNMLVKLTVLAYFVTLPRNGKSVTCGFPYVFT